MIKVENLTKEFDKKLFNLTFKSRPGQITIISGPSGSGKTTLLKILSGFENKTTGVYDISESIGFLFQEDTTCSWLTVEQNIFLPFKLKGIKILENRINLFKELCLELQIEEILKKKVSNISGGEKERMLLLRELLQDKKVYLLDEPLTALQEDFQLKIFKYLIKYFKNKKKEVIISSHNERFKKLGDQIIKL